MYIHGLVTCLAILFYFFTATLWRVSRVGCRDQSTQTGHHGQPPDSDRVVFGSIMTRWN